MELIAFCRKEARRAVPQSGCAFGPSDNHLRLYGARFVPATSSHRVIERDLRSAPRALAMPASRGNVLATWINREGKGFHQTDIPSGCRLEGRRRPSLRAAFARECYAAYHRTNLKGINVDLWARNVIRRFHPVCTRRCDALCSRLIADVGSTESSVGFVSNQYRANERRSP